MKMQYFTFALLISTQFAVAMDTIDISGLDKKAVLNALYKRARAQGSGIYHYHPNSSLSDSQASAILEHGYVDYLYGRVMKINLSGDTVNTRLYNRDNGEGAAEEAITQLRNLR